jgi:ferredoxin-NADP reductase/MOSC domain-containing protein YiiM
MARLVSVNVGMPRDVEWEGRIVHTGIWKDPVEGPRMVRRLNIDGDGQGDLGGHGGVNRAVFVYQLESHRYWEDFLGRDALTPGQFGENFTVEGLPDDEVCIGDRYRIGGALFEVSQPRVTCYRVGLRMSEPRMPALLVAHRRPGFYFRVLEEGEVTPGDAIERVERGPEEMTVAEIDALLYLPGHARRDLERALRIPALSEGWQGSFREMLQQHGAAVDAPAWAGMRAMRVAGIDRESAGVISIRLVPADGEPAAPARPGQFLTVRLHPAGDAALLRTYSLSGLPGTESYRISVKREPHGVASEYLHTRLRVGDVIDAGAPRGSFVLRPGERPVVLMSAGVGATPVLAMLHVLVAERSARPVWWLHGARNRAEHPFAALVDELLSRLPNGRRHVRYSRPGPGDRIGPDYDAPGRLTAEVARELGVPLDADHYLCGPAAFLEELPAGLVTHGVRPERVRVEVFGSQGALEPGVVPSSRRPPHPPPGAAGSGPLVEFARSSVSTRFDPQYGTLLELAEACDVPVRWSCRTGVCHTCETDLLGGAVVYEPEPIDAPPAGRVLICSAQPTDDVVLDL